MIVLLLFVLFAAVLFGIAGALFGLFGSLLLGARSKRVPIIIGAVIGFGLGYWFEFRGISVIAAQGISWYGKDLSTMFTIPLASCVVLAFACFFAYRPR